MLARPGLEAVLIHECCRMEFIHLRHHAQACRCHPVQCSSEHALRLKACIQSVLMFSNRHAFVHRCAGIHLSCLHLPFDLKRPAGSTVFRCTFALGCDLRCARHGMLARFEFCGVLTPDDPEFRTSSLVLKPQNMRRLPLLEARPSRRQFCSIVHSLS